MQFEFQKVAENKAKVAELRRKVAQFGVFLAEWYTFQLLWWYTFRFHFFDTDAKNYPENAKKMLKSASSRSIIRIRKLLKSYKK